MNQYKIFKAQQQGSLEQQTADIKQQLDSWQNDNRISKPSTISIQPMNTV